MSPIELAGVAAVAVVAYVVMGIMTTAVYSFGVVKLGRKLPEETGLAWCVVGWPLTFFVAIGLALRYAAQRMQDQVKLEEAKEGQVPTVRRESGRGSM